MLRRRSAHPVAGLTVWRPTLIEDRENARFRATPEELQMIFDRSMGLRLAERNRQGVPAEADDKVKKVAKEAATEALTKWRDATDRVLRKPP